MATAGVVHAAPDSCCAYERLPDGPSQEERDGQRARAVVEVTGADGVVVRAIVETLNGYSYTPVAAVEATRRVLDGEHRAGFETPARVFGAGFAESIVGTQVTELSGSRCAD